jgi:hypothetical protein
MAGNLLHAVESGSIDQLTSELRRAVDYIAQVRADPSAESPERLDLLDAITGDMNRGVDRMRRTQRSELEGMEIHLHLLRHLASASGRH